MRQPLYKTFGSIELNPALKAAGWLAGYRRVGVCFCAMHFAQRTRATVMRETYLLFARRTASISIVLWTIALSFSVIGL